MLDFIALLLRYLVASLDLAWAGYGPIAALAVVGAVGVTAAAIAICVVLLAVGFGDRASSVIAHGYLQTIDVSRLFSQSDPNAAGRPRPRAPGCDHSVA
jgi:hypothetical protein